MLKKLLVLLGVFCIIFCSANNNTDVPQVNGGDTPGETHKKLALLVGIDDYKVVSDLSGCINDVRDMKDLLINNFEFAEDDIMTLTNEEATHKGIVDAFRSHLTAKASAGTIVVFHYSGHGSQMQDAQDGDEQFDHLDETIVPHDSRTEGKYDIRDDELNGLFNELTKKTKYVTFILDSCHSGSGIRGLGIPRRVEADLRKPPPAEPYEVSTRGTSKKDNRFENLNYVLISGCQAEEVSFETILNGVRRGALTYYLVKEIREANKAEITYQDVMDQVKVNVTRENNTQHPQIEGKLLNNYIFSDKSNVTVPYVPASGKGDNVILEAGLVHGAVKGSKYYVFKPGTKNFDDPDEALADIELTATNAFSSEAKIIKFKKAKNPGDILQASRAVEYEHAYEIETFPIYFLQPEDVKDYFPETSITLTKPDDSDTLKKTASEIGKKPHYVIVKKGNEAQLLLAEVQGKIKIYRNSGQEIIDSAVSTNAAGAAASVMKQLEHWSKWYNVLSITNSKSKYLEVELEVKGITNTGNREGTETMRVPTQQFTHEDEINFIVKNTGNKKLFFVILDISSDGSIAVIHPKTGDGEALLPGKNVDITDQEAFVADNYREVTDIIKVIATDKQLNFKFLEMDAASARDLATKGIDDPLTRLFKEAALQSTTKGVRPKALDEWVTTESVFKVTRK
ncbi:MAG: caspase family protein [Candidatus Aminicenantes bacterium]|nr:caspase family protein [Candidatus Aminicenantes bacterium]